MKFGAGTSRIVVCVGPWAIKFARIRAIHWMIRIPKKILVSRCDISVEKIVDPTYTKSRLQHLFTGVVANLEEYWYWKQNPGLPLADTIFSFFGLINIQLRGKPIAEAELSVCPFREIAHTDFDLQRAVHFGRVKGRIVLLDYGSKELNAAISNIAGSTEKSVVAA